MLQISICVGSSCHLKGSYQIIKVFEELVRAKNLEDKVELKASFCLGRCADGVSAKIGDEFVEKLTISTARNVFEEYVIGNLK